MGSGSGSTAARQLRVVPTMRAQLIAVVGGTSGLVAHTVAMGHSPHEMVRGDSWAGVFVVLLIALTGLGAVLYLADERRSISRSAVVLGTLQLVHHLALSAGASGVMSPQESATGQPAIPAGHHHSATALDMIDSLVIPVWNCLPHQTSATATMLSAHFLAAIVTALVTDHGGRAVRLMIAALISLVPLARLLAIPALVPTPARGVIYAQPPTLRSRIHEVVSSRGPPPLPA